MDEVIATEALTEQEREARVAYHTAALKKLNAIPRSDWHAGFEALLRIEAHPYGDLVRISTEEEIGVLPPRTDFVILVEDERVEWDKAIFKAFRQINILEYKNPHDSLNERVLRKACGYANLYIGTAEHEGDRPSDQVTISVFRAVKNPRLFAELERAGRLVRDEVPGIYHVTRYTDLPFQIIITGELEGEEYAAYRALTDRADAEDVLRVMQVAKREADDVVRDHYLALLRLVMAKNPQAADTIRRGKGMTKEEMDDILLDMVKDRVDAEKQQTEQQTLVNCIENIMESFGVTMERAMDTLKIPQSQRENYAALIGKLA